MAIFPSAISTDSDLFVAVNMLSTQLTDNPLSNSATTVNVVDASSFPSVGYVSIDSEIIKYTGKTGTSFTGCTRAADGSTAASHVQNSQVFHNVIAAHHNVLKEEIKAIETELGVNGATFLKKSGGTMTGALISTAGTAALPAIGIGAVNTGIYSRAANLICLATNGTLKWEVNGAGDLINQGTSGYIGAHVGSVSSPSYSFATATGTGMYSRAGGYFNVAVNGNMMFESDGSSSSFFGSGGVQLKGVETNNNASAGYVGEYIEALNVGDVNAATSGDYDDLSSISLTAGDWDVSASMNANINGSTWSVAIIGLGTTSGNSGAGLTGGNTASVNAWANSSTTPVAVNLSVGPCRFSLSSTTTVYLKRSFIYTAGTPKKQATSKISARRVR